MSAELVVDVPEESGRNAALSVLEATRPRQWTKNLLLFAGIVFAARLGDATRWAEALAAFAAYCAASGAAYLLNDLRDREADRAHPVKRARPLARGDVGTQTAAVAAGVLVAGALAAAAALGPASAGLLGGFLLLQLAYTTLLKHVPVADVLAIAGLFVIRAAAGAAAVHVRISPWLLVCTALLALFLALAKRRGELVLVDADATPGRRVLERYSRALLDRLLLGVAGVTVAVYAAYTVAGDRPAALPATIPFVAFGVFRYVRLCRRHGLGEEPDQVLLGDRPILVAVALWVAACAAVLGLG
jgi:4-hydroxybenzoate polyprenyltransferase